MEFQLHVYSFHGRNKLSSKTKWKENTYKRTSYKLHILNLQGYPNYRMSIADTSPWWFLTQAHLYKMKLRDTPSCECGVSGDLTHLLFECWLQTVIGCDIYRKVQQCTHLLAKTIYNLLKRITLAEWRLLKLLKLTDRPHCFNRILQMHLLIVWSLKIKNENPKRKMQWLSPNKFHYN